MPNEPPPMLPDPPHKEDMQGNQYFSLFGTPNTIGRHFDCYPFRLDSTTLVAGRGYICPTRKDWPGSPHPNLVIAFDVDPAAIIDANAYVINEVGKPPDFVLEIGYDDTYLEKYPDPKADYQRFAIPEYWRYDHTGGKYYGVPLDGCRLAPDGAYRPIEMHTEADGVTWGYSESLQLSLCWVDRYLRFWSRIQQRYLPTPSELADARIAAEARAQAAENRTAPPTPPQPPNARPRVDGKPPRP